MTRGAQITCLLALFAAIKDKKGRECGGEGVVSISGRMYKVLCTWGENRGRLRSRTASRGSVVHVSCQLGDSGFDASNAGFDS